MNIKKYGITGLFLGTALLALGGAYYFYHKEQPDAPLPVKSALATKQERQAISIAGLVPGTEVSYQLMPVQGSVGAGKATADETGTLEIPGDTLDPKRNHFTYNLQIDKGSDSLDLNFKINRGTGDVAVSGRGADKFSDVRIKGGAGEIETKADWAGVFEGTQKEALNSESGGEKSFEVALYGNDVLDGMREEAPLLIKVFDAPGGGGPGTQGVNQYQNPSNAECGTPQASYCRQDRLRRQIDYIVNNYVVTFILMTQELSAVMMQQMLILGQFFDAKQQLETQRQLQLMQAEAHKDYHPSEMMCQFGSFIKSVPRSDEKAGFEQQALNKILMAAQTSQRNTAGAQLQGEDMQARVTQFREVYCDPKDNNSGLQMLCDHEQDKNPATGGLGARDKTRINKDIDYMRTLYFPLTLNVNFSNPARGPDNRVIGDEEDVVALARNLYWPRVFHSSISQELEGKYDNYMSARQLIAMNNVAQNTFTNIVGMKSSAPPSATAPDGSGAYMKSLMRDFGLSDADIELMLGQFPSYYAQMEMLTKKIYQSPDFYTNLYDKPANVDRIGVSLEAINLMQNRDMLEASLRREMLASLLVEQALTKHVRRTNSSIDIEAGN
jgi:hypothetical protein